MSICAEIVINFRFPDNSVFKPLFSLLLKLMFCCSKQDKNKLGIVTTAGVAFVRHHKRQIFRAVKRGETKRSKGCTFLISGKSSGTSNSLSMKVFTR